MFPSSKDSLINLRIQSQKRSSPSAAVPLEELREKISSKRQRRSNSVSFNLDHNQIHTRHMTDEDLSRAWMNENESTWVKHAMIYTVVSSRKGCLDTDNDCVRGLEAYASPERTKEKIKKGKAFVTLILEQQKLLKGVMGKANESMLARMSQVLSAADTKQAAERGAMDAEEAFMIHAFSQSNKEQHINEHRLAKMLRHGVPLKRIAAKVADASSSRE